jgi:hypothetical protein
VTIPAGDFQAPPQLPLDANNQVACMHPVYNSIIRSINPPVNDDPLNPFCRGDNVTVVGNDDDEYPVLPPPFNHKVTPWGAIGIDIDLH